MTLTRYGLREWLIITVVAAAAAVALGSFGWWWGIPVVFVLWLALVAFFRDPTRTVPDNMPDDVYLSPSDGVVSAVLRVDDHEATGGPATVVRIFLSVLDVHVNRAPCDGEVVAMKHTPGKYLNAQTEESASVNESLLTTLRVASDETIGMRQVAGMIARRIVCKLEVGSVVRRGRRFGMIKFGSTAELILPRPDETRIHVQKGERVWGGLTQLATLPAPAGREPTTPDPAQSPATASASGSNACARAANRATSP